MVGEAKASSGENEGKLEEQTHSVSTSGLLMDRLQDKNSCLHIKAHEQKQFQKS